MRYLAAKDTAGLAVFFVKASSLVPLPPARIMATTFLDIVKSPFASIIIASTRVYG